MVVGRGSSPPLGDAVAVPDDVAEWTALIASGDAYNRRRCIEDPMFLLREVLGEAGVEAGIYSRNLFRTPCVFHLEACEVMKNNENALFLAPRIHMKTACITVGGTVHSLLRNPNHRNLLASETPALGTKILREVKWHFQSNRRLLRWFPEYRMSSKEEGTQNHFDIPCRTGPKKDFSVEAIGIGGATAGGHFDTLRLSDILSDKTVPPMVTPETMQKTWHQVRAMSSLLDKTNKSANFVIEGTVWHHGDAYMSLRGDSGYRYWRKIIYSAWANKSKRIPLWPEVYSADELDRIRGEIGTYLWSCNWENEPQPDEEEVMFQPSYFKLYEYGDGSEGITGCKPGACPCCGGALNVAVTVDPAIGKKRSNDRTAMVTSGVCPRGSLVVVTTRAQRMEPGLIVEGLYEMDKVERPSWIGIETVAFQKLFLYILYEESKKEGRYSLSLRELKSDEQKERRIGMLAAFARSRGIWVRPGDHDELVDECLKMTLTGTVGKHDDLPDALAFRLQSMNRPDSVREVDVPRLAIPGSSQVTGAEVLGRIYDAEIEASEGS